MSIEQRFTRRELMRGSVLAAMAAMSDWPLAAFGADERDGDQVIPFLDFQPVNPNRPMVNWQELTSWMTPTKDIFAVSHYSKPEPIKADDWQLQISGLIAKPMALTLKDLQARPHTQRTATLECSGNGASPSFMGAIGNAHWTGTPLAPILKECGVKDGGIEVVFFAADKGKETIRKQQFEQHFARSLHIDDAMSENVILAWELNGKPLASSHGYPVRLVVPGWYGIAWVKWLMRIEVHDRRFMGRFMARDYVTIRGEPKGDDVVWRETSVGRMNIKSLVARVVKHKDGAVTVAGAAWNDGTPLKSVEVKIDDGPWQAAKLHQDEPAPYAWTFWSYDWKGAAAGGHSLVSRATDAKGRVQPTADDPSIKLKKTYWEANQQVVRRIKL